MTLKVNRELDEVKNYAFQYYANGKMIENTGLITRVQAEELWGKYESHFVKQVECKNDAEMVIWENMNDATGYHSQMKHIRSKDIVLKDGLAYTLEPVF